MMCIKCNSVSHTVVRFTIAKQNCCTLKKSLKRGKKDEIRIKKNTRFLVQHFCISFYYLLKKEIYQ